MNNKENLSKEPLNNPKFVEQIKLASVRTPPQIGLVSYAPNLKKIISSSESSSYCKIDSPLTSAYYTEHVINLQAEQNGYPCHIKQNKDILDTRHGILLQSKPNLVSVSTLQSNYKTHNLQDNSDTYSSPLPAQYMSVRTKIPEIVLSPTISHSTNWWVQYLGLTMEDYRILMSPTQYLNDRIIMASMKLIKKRFPSVNGLYDTLRIPRQVKIWKYENPFPFTKSPALQIHHDGKSHWVTSVKVHDNVYLLDSLGMAVNTCIEIQLGAMYGSPGKNLKVILPDIQMQKSTNDCGLFAIANAVEFCSSNLYCGLDPLYFDDSPMRMRMHLLTCLGAQMIEPFPSTKTNGQVEVREHIITNIISWAK